MFKDLAPKPRPGRVCNARGLRKSMSLPEVLLWQQLRLRSHQVKFRRQHPSGPYVLDFYCGDARLAIEIDGNTHDQRNRIEADAVRDRYFAERGIETLRIGARDVLRDAVATADAVIHAARARLPLHHPAAPDGPPPRA